MRDMATKHQPICVKCSIIMSLLPRRQRWACAMIAMSLSTLSMTARADTDVAPALGQGDERAGQGFRQWLVHLDVAGVLMNESATIDIGGHPIQDGSVAIGNDPTLTLDASYFFTPNLAINLYSGIPPRAAVKGAGSLASLGTLATTRYGSVAVSAEYHATNFGRFKPYVGIGVDYTPFLDVQDRTLQNVHIPNIFGAAFKVGADYDLADRWTAHVYVQQILLETRVSATVAGLAVTSETTINPTVVGAGVGWRF